MNEWELAHFHSDVFHGDGPVKEIRVRARVFRCVGRLAPNGHAPARFELEVGGRVVCHYCQVTYLQVDHQTSESVPEACTLSQPAIRAARAAYELENFRRVQRAEEAAIEARRRLVNEDHRRHHPNEHPRELYRDHGRVRNLHNGSRHSTQVKDTVGLALSGGGIRSAAFALGAMQRLQSENVFARVDYLSTVSGGGYMGCCYTAAVQRRFKDGHYPPDWTDNGTQAEARNADRDARLATLTGPDEESDSAGVAHIRDYSNYLMPKGVGDLLVSAAVAASGLLVNALIVFAAVLLAAVVTIRIAPNETKLLKSGLVMVAEHYHWLDPYWHWRHIFVSQYSASLLMIGIDAVLLLVWASRRAWQSAPAPRHMADSPNAHAADTVPVLGDKRFDVLMSATQWLFVLTAVALFCDLQFSLLFAIFHNEDEFTKVLGWLLGRINQWSFYLAPVTGLLVLMRGKLADLLETEAQKPGVISIIKKLLVQAVFIVGGMLLPLLIWVAYLNMAFWGIDSMPTTPESVRWVTKRQQDGSYTPFNHAPDWMSTTGKYLHTHWGSMHIGLTDIGTLYLWALVACVGVLLVLFVVLFFVSFPRRSLDPNALSLHRLYRRRLAKTFLFDPLWRFDAESDEKLKRADLFSLDLPAPDLAPRSRLLLSDLAPDQGPYLLINAALNLEGSRVSNRRGRNADFFTFSRDYIGSDPTGYARTRRVESQDVRLDLATAMAISGAAVSSNMGASTIRWLRCTLTLLNLRLGYWLVNPKLARPPTREERAAREEAVRREEEEILSGPRRWLRGVKGWVDTNLGGYFFSEMLGLLNEESPRVYLTDGGHIENLGLYQLLKRKCQLIVVIDAEADPALSFRSLTIAERYARIDLGVHIDLPWEAIRDRALQVDAQCAASDQTKDPLVPQAGPHCAIGRIYYPGDEEGLLLYVKSSLSGDEQDYILNYKARNLTFPHETTMEQFFSEEQFEAYRWLGHHAMGDIFAPNAKIATPTASDPLRQKIESREMVAEVLKRLGAARVGGAMKATSVIPGLTRDPEPRSG